MNDITLYSSNPVGSGGDRAMSGAEALNESANVVMNDKVQGLAGSIYEEFEAMMAKYDESVVKNLMPQIVAILESLDIAFTEVQEMEVEVELLKEDNEQLVTQYEREKHLRKAAEEKSFISEDAMIAEKKELTAKIENLTSIIKMMELRAKNSQDHIVRLEEKEAEMKKEYSKLHSRYTELFKTHIEYMERTKLAAESLQQESKSDTNPNLFGSSRSRLSNLYLNNLNNRSSGPTSFGFSELEIVEDPTIGVQDSRIQQDTPESDEGQSEIKYVDTSLMTEMESPEHNSSSLSNRKGGWTEGLSPESDVNPEFEVSIRNRSKSYANTPSFLPDMTKSFGGHSHTKTETRTGNTLYQELSFQGTEMVGEVDEGADISGMGREVDNLITENSELLATKNALNIVKDDLITKLDELTGEHEIMREDILSLSKSKQELECENSVLSNQLRKVKEEIEAIKNDPRNLEEDGVETSAHRKRFTRIEMARAIMERNQYKERFMELQETVRWTEIIRASKSDAITDKNSKQGFWKIFSNLFSSPTRNSGTDPLVRPYVYTKYAGSAYRSVAGGENQANPLEMMRAKSLAERRDSKTEDGSIQNEGIMRPFCRGRFDDEGRIQAYGWSLPASHPGKTGVDGTGFDIPVPVYCRPLTENEHAMKIWCAAGVNLTGGKTSDGGKIVGASVFYNDSPDDDGSQPLVRPLTPCPGEANCRTDEVNRLADQLSANRNLAASSIDPHQHLSSLVWICTTTHAVSKVTVIDANNPSEILDSFQVCSSHLLCIASVPGAQEYDYSDEDVSDDTQLEEAKEASETNDDYDETIGSITVKFVSCSSGNVTSENRAHNILNRTRDVNKISNKTYEISDNLCEKSDNVDEMSLPFVSHHTHNVVREMTKHGKANVEEALKLNHLDLVSSVLPTMWLGSQSGFVYVHGSVDDWKRCLHSIKLKDAVLNIVHFKSRVLVALANGSIAFFHRKPKTAVWNFDSYHLLDLGKPNHAIRCMIQVHNKIWCGYRNCVFVICPNSMKVETNFEAHPRKESQVRQMTWIGDGVWISIRLDSTLRLFHAHTHQHLQDVDVEPYVSKMIGSNSLGFSFVRITSLIVSCNRLWIGTGNGVIISAPLNVPRNPGGLIGSHGCPGTTVRVFMDRDEKNIIPESFDPYCQIDQAQMSFHGHRDSVKFFVAVPGHGGLRPLSGSKKLPSPIKQGETDASMLILSGGEGYVDFRIGTCEPEDVCAREKSHLVVWQLPWEKRRHNISPNFVE